MVNSSLSNTIAGCGHDGEDGMVDNSKISKQSSIVHLLHDKTYFSDYH